MTGICGWRSALGQARLRTRVWGEPSARSGRRNFDPLPHAPGSSPYVSTGDYLLGLMKDDVPRTCTYGLS
jgi:hypothetical protein